MRSTGAEPKVVVSAQVPRNQRDELERIARDQDRTISYLVRQAVDSYLAHARPRVGQIREPSS